MADAILTRRSGADVSEATAIPNKVLIGETFYAGEDDDIQGGAMPNRGAVNQALNAGGVYTIQEGYHTGSGKVTAAGLSGQTAATATAEQVLGGQTAWVNGVKVTGAMTNRGAQTATLDAGTQHPIPKGYHDGGGVIEAKDLASQTRGTANGIDVLAGKTSTVNGVFFTGTMVNNGDVSKVLNCGEVYYVSKGYHNGGGTIAVNSLASQTPATAAAGQVLGGQTVWVNGSKLTGTMTNHRGVRRTISSGGTYSIPGGFHDGSGYVSAGNDYIKLEGIEYYTGNGEYYTVFLQHSMGLPPTYVWLSADLSDYGGGTQAHGVLSRFKDTPSLTAGSFIIEDITSRWVTVKCYFGQMNPGIITVTGKAYLLE